jgi:hypothetical protein
MEKNQIIPDKILKCSCCEKEKHSTEYSWVSKGDTSPYKTLNSTKCKSCQDQDRILVSKLKKQHKLPANNLCEICGKPPEKGKILNCDHNHQTGEYRGYLCTKCNVGLGNLGDTEECIEKTLKYLKKAKNKNMDKNLELIKYLIDNNQIEYAHLVLENSKNNESENEFVETKKIKTKKPNSNFKNQTEKWINGVSKELSEFNENHIKLIEVFGTADNYHLFDRKAAEKLIHVDIDYYKVKAGRGWHYAINKEDKLKVKAILK